MRLGPVLLVTGLALGTLFILLVPTWDLPVKGTQLGWRASSMIQWANDDPQVTQMNQPPPKVQAVPPDPRPATEAYKNVKVLTDVNAGQFMALQYAMTAWVAPQQGCAFCHEGNDYASDANPHKQAARVMLQMTRHINADWTNHVGTSGVTCYSCHRSRPVPSAMWFPRTPAPENPWIDKQEDWNEASRTVRGFFPVAGYEEYLLQDEAGVAQSRTALPTGEVAAQVVVKRLYEMMMQMSDGIGVNCGYCHNSRAFTDWQQSTPARWTGYYGIEMTRDINRNFIAPLATVIPQTRQPLITPLPPVVPTREAGVLPGNGMALCKTCHYGLPKPLDAAGMLQEFPGLKGPATTSTASITPAAATTPAAPALTR
jgi:photosynthetic reaction center cytochrome c subunit